MENNGFEEKTSMRSVLDGFISSYAERDTSEDFSGWLDSRLRQEMPDMAEETSRKLADEIIEAVAGYEETLAQLNDAAGKGVSKEEWFASRMSETYADMAVDDAGEKLQKAENELAVANMQLMGESGEWQPDENPVGWNEYSVKDEVRKIGKHIALSGMAVAANVIKDRTENEETAEISDIARDTLRDGLKKDSAEVKAMVAGAVKVAAKKKLEDALPEDTPTDTICGMAGVAVESAEALFDVADGKSTTYEAMDRIGMASVAAGCHYCAGTLKGWLSARPFGPVLVDLAGGLLDHLDSPKFAENVYKVVHGAAVATWEGIKNSRIVATIKGIGSKIKEAITQ